MDLPIMLLVLVAGPILLLWWSVHVARRWKGSWRRASLLPGGIFAAGLLRALMSVRGDLGVHSGWGMPLLISIGVAGVVAFLLNERHEAAIRTTPLERSPDEPAPHTENPMNFEQAELIFAELQRLGIRPDAQGIFTFESDGSPPAVLLARLRALPDGAGPAAAFAASSPKGSRPAPIDERPA